MIKPKKRIYVLVLGIASKECLHEIKKEFKKTGEDCHVEIIKRPRSPKFHLTPYSGADIIVCDEKFYRAYPAELISLARAKEICIIMGQKKRIKIKLEIDQLYFNPKNKNLKKL